MHPERDVGAVKRRSAPRSSSEQDEGSVLILALATIIIGAMIVLPTMTYTMTVTRAGRIVQHKVSRAEAVKGGLRTALADGKALYEACKDGFLGSPLPLAAPGLDIAVDTTCTKVKDTYAVEDFTTLPYAAVNTWAGSVLPGGLSGTTYPVLLNADPTAWSNPTNSSITPVGSKVWTPQLPVIPNDGRLPSGFGMPAAYATSYGPCRVFFPGKYVARLDLTGVSDYFFVSGVYYFESTVRISGDAHVVIGEGATEACTNDQDAVSYADYSTPFNHNKTGAGATFVFGSAGQLVVDDVTPSTKPAGASVTFNKRLVAPTETGVLSSAGVSIISVNGVLNGTTIDNLSAPLVAPVLLSVPASLVATTPPTPASGTTFKPSTLVPAIPPAAPIPPIVDINLSGAGAVTVQIDSYIAVPQGTVNVTTAPAAGTFKAVSMLGGVLAANINVSADRPATFVVGLVNQVVQKTLKIVSITSNGNPLVSATAIVLVNDTGDSAITSYVVQGT